jgi:5,10-methylene-tetrahydrofolate dehydrogenase/methenyl tetrahydrofolate cyclohydrolase
MRRTEVEMPGERMNGDGGALVPVVGRTGLLGRRVALLLRQEGHRVRASHASEA